MNNNNFYKHIETYVTGLFEKAPNPNLIYHNLTHTKTVVERSREIAEHYHLSERDMMILCGAAWFHDTGHLFTDTAHHEEKGVQVMKEFMMSNNNDPELTTEIGNAILSTKAPRHPGNLLQQILCDADTYHFGTKEFKDSNKRMREECILCGGKMDKDKWNKKTLEMLEEHQFYTTYCLNLLEEQKKSNMKKLKKKLEVPEEKNGDLTAKKNDDLTTKKNDDLTTKKNDGLTTKKNDGLTTKKNDDLTIKKSDELIIRNTNNLTTKGIQTMLRLTSENHLKLSDMADHKANILISVNAIIISVILGVLLRKLQEAPNLTVPTVIFLLVAVTTIVIAILATRPKLSSGTFSSQDIMNKKTNLLFFGNFHKASYEEYDRAMRNMMQDPDYLYGSLIKDIYQLGVVLGRKYKLVHLAYNIFMIGIVIAVLAFAIAALFFSSGNVPSATISTGSPL
jgi:predicted metal-dependent HD superfamily phosphohydrolase